MQFVQIPNQIKSEYYKALKREKAEAYEGTLSIFQVLITQVRESFLLSFACKIDEKCYIARQ